MSAVATRRRLLRAWAVLHPGESDREMPAWFLKALRDSGVSVSRATAYRWINEETQAPPEALALVRRLERDAVRVLTQRIQEMKPQEEEREG